MSAALVAVALVEKIAALGVIVSSLELLFRHRDLRDDGMFAWSVASVRAPLPPIVVRAGSVLFSQRAILLVLICRMSAALALLVAAPTSPLRAPMVGVVTLGYAWVFLRAPLGHDGADQMTYVTSLSCLLARLVGTERGLMLALAFIAAQATLAYFVAGVAKAVSPLWIRVGFRGILGTTAYGNERLAKLSSSRPRLTSAIAAGVVSWECAFPLIWFLPWSLAWPFLAIGAAFHLGTGIVMGLNNFMWAFVATYAAIVYWLHPESLKSLVFG
jgi:hypothetical protein